MDTVALKGLLKFQIVRHINRSSRAILNLMEDIKVEQEQSMTRALKNIPKEYHDAIIQANIFDSNRMEYLRKRILDNGGDFQRDVLSELDGYEVNINLNR